MNSTELLTALNWRYATKSFDTEKKLDASQLDTLLESLRFSPSSFGLQPWKFVLVESEEILSQLRQTNHTQWQVMSAPYIFVLCAKDTMTSEDITHHIQYLAQERWIEETSLDGYRDMMLWYVGWKSDERKANRNEKQVYIAQWVLLSACAMLGIDSCPMEGFDRHSYDEILWLAWSGYHSVVIVPVGYRSSEDKYAHVPKVRFAKEELIVIK